MLCRSVLLRQNPHNATEWMKRVKLVPTDQVEQVIKTYAQAVSTIDAQKASGHPHALWINFAKFYESEGDLDNARVIFEQATHVNFKQVPQLAAIWLEWAELEIRHNHHDAALQVMRRATGMFTF